MPVTTQRLLIAALSALIIGTSVNAQAVFLGDVALSALDAPLFGGLSAIEMTEGGTTAIVLSDRGTLFDLSLIRDGPTIVAVTLLRTAPITWEEGIHLPSIQRDSEGLAILPDGTLAISFEGGPHARVALHRRDGVQTTTLPAIRGAAALPRNGAFEGLAVDAQGRLYTVPESSFAAEEGHGPEVNVVMRLERDGWERFALISRSRGWSPVALDFDERGRLYMLERRESILVGFTSRLTRFETSNGSLGMAEVLLQTTAGRHGNLEGLSVWRDRAGRLIATMVSDDNFLPFLSMALVEYALPD